eukprot:jgi/Bigna1/78979/fgenesh1_pg.58_\
MDYSSSLSICNEWIHTNKLMRTWPHMALLSLLSVSSLVRHVGGTTAVAAGSSTSSSSSILMQSSAAAAIIRRGGVMSHIHMRVFGSPIFSTRRRINRRWGGAWGSYSSTNRAPKRLLSSEAVIAAATSEEDIKKREAKAMDLYDYAAEKAHLNRHSRGCDSSSADNNAVTGQKSHEEILQDLRNETETVFPLGAHMMLGPLEASLLEIIVKLSEAERILEIGSFTGYSAFSMARGLKNTGTSSILSIDHDKRCQTFHQKYAKIHPLGHKIKFVHGDAFEVLNKLPEEQKQGTSHISAIPHQHYYYLLLVLSTSVDNVLFRGKVAELAALTPQQRQDLNVRDNEQKDGGGEVKLDDNGMPLPLTPEEKRLKKEAKFAKRHRAIAQALDDFNVAISRDVRMESALLPIRDGLTIARRRCK